MDKILVMRKVLFKTKYGPSYSFCAFEYTLEKSVSIVNVSLQQARAKNKMNQEHFNSKTFYFFGIEIHFGFVSGRGKESQELFYHFF